MTTRITKRAYRMLRDAIVQILVEGGVAEGTVTEVLSRLDEHVSEVFGIRV